MPEKFVEKVEPGSVQTLRDLVNNLDRMERDYKASVERQRGFQWAILAAGVVVAILLVGLIFTAASVRGLVNQLNDCTTPGGTCYDEGQRRTGEAVANIYWGNIYMAECSRLHPNESGPVFDRKLESCVAARIKARTPK